VRERNTGQRSGSARLDARIGCLCGSQRLLLDNGNETVELAVIFADAIKAGARQLFTGAAAQAGLPADVLFCQWRLFDHLRDKIQSGFSFRCNLLEIIAIICLVYDIRTQTLGRFQRMSQRFHTTGIDRVQLLDEGQDVRQVAGIFRYVVGINTESRQVGNFLNLSSIKAHGDPVVG
jgi:hypothetical protein